MTEIGFPSTQPIAVADFVQRVVVLHYWAAWNSRDRDMSTLLGDLRETYADRICFRSCDIDRLENQQYVHRVTNIPALGCFIYGKWFESLIGLRPHGELRAVFERWLAAAASLDVVS